MTHDFDAALGALAPLFRELDQLQQRAVQVYAPEVDALVRTNSRDVQSIERTLDGLLSFCGDASALALFKRLWRDYWGSIRQRQPFTSSAIGRCGTAKRRATRRDRRAEALDGRSRPNARWSRPEVWTEIERPILMQMRKIDVAAIKAAVRG